VPSLQQLRYEAFADDVERALRRSRIVRYLARGRDRLIVRVQNQAGGHLEFQLLEVDLDGGFILGRAPSGDPVRLPLRNAKTIWRRRRLIAPSLRVWLTAVFACGFVGAAIAAIGAWSVRDGAGIGALFGGLVAGFSSLIFLEDRPAFYEWVTIYDEAAA
jgi:hypothetical protein